MPKRPALTDLTSNYGAQSVINANNDKIEEAFDNTISRDGSTPNQMEADFDMNDNDILNAGVVNAAEFVQGGVSLLSLTNPVTAAYAIAQLATAVQELEVLLNGKVDKADGGALPSIFSGGEETRYLIGSDKAFPAAPRILDRDALFETIGIRTGADSSPASGMKTVTFDVPMQTSPKIFLAVRGSGANARIAKFDSPSETGFTFKVVDETGAHQSGVTVHWMAIED